MRPSLALVYADGNGGTAIVMTADGYLITNAHTVSGAESITVQLSDGTEYAAALSGMAQSLGYFLGAVGPFALGKVFSLASNWTIPLAMLLAFAGLEILVGYMAGRPIVIPAEKARTEKL